MIDHATSESPASYTSDLTRKLVTDAEILSRFSLDETSTPLEEEQVLSDLIKGYDCLDVTSKQELTELASLLNDDQGLALRSAICRPGSAEILSDENAMQAFITLLPPAGGGKPLTTADIIAMLKERGIIFGVDLSAIATGAIEVARGLHKSLKIRVAVGKEPVNGESGCIEFHVGTTLPAGGKNKRQQWMTKTGELLAHLIPPTPGFCGSDIFGHEVPSIPGIQAHLDTGDGITFDAEQNAYIAQFDGLAILDNQKLEMRRQFVWDGDLNIHDPLINFDGAVIIHGTVRDGVTLSATGDIEIHEGIEAASVISTNGSIHIKQGITGHGRGYVSAKSGIDVKYIENGIVYCQEDILVRHAVLHSRLTAGRRISVELGKGAVFGGELRAGEEIIAKSFGNVAGVATRLSVGHSWSSLRKLQDCEAALATLRQNSAMCETLITKFRQARPQLTSLSMPERSALSSLIKRHMVLKARIHRHEQAYNELDSSWILEGSGRIKCHESLYPGVTVKMGAATVLISLNHTACTLKLQPEEKRIAAVSSAGRKTFL